jgi:hypothetical protein
MVAHGVSLVEEFPIWARLYFHSFNCGAQLRQLKANIWLRLWRELTAKTVSGMAVITTLD